MSRAALCAHVRLLVEAVALQQLNPSSRQAVASLVYRRRQIAMAYPSVSIHRLETVAQSHAATRIAIGHGRTIRRAIRDAADRASRLACRQMLAAVAGRVAA